MPARVLDLDPGRPLHLEDPDPLLQRVQPPEPVSLPDLRVRLLPERQPLRQGLSPLQGPQRPKWEVHILPVSQPQSSGRQVRRPQLCQGCWGDLCLVRRQLCVQSGGEGLQVYGCQLYESWAQAVFGV